ncbi:MAG: hypothetical protein PHV51_08610, partial [Methanosarcinaceae archaeon]|nr:hypothetical protein [Methanosarcinaceae archaeon]
MQRTLKYVRNGRGPKPGIFACFLLALGCFLLVSADPTFAKTLTVDVQGWADFRSIQTAVDQAETGDTVFVYAGEYNENVLVGKSLTLIAENRAVPSENPGIGASDSLEVSQITPEINKITPEINKITPEINKIIPEVNRITEEFDLDPGYETLIYISPSIKNTSSASLLLILDAAGQIDLLEEIENGPFSESEKLVLGESVREIRKKYPIAFLRRDRVVYSDLIS